MHDIIGMINRSDENGIFEAGHLAGEALANTIEGTKGSDINNLSEAIYEHILIHTSDTQSAANAFVAGIVAGIRSEYCDADVNDMLDDSDAADIVTIQSRIGEA